MKKITKVIAFHNTKGGTLKTTLCTNIAGLLAKENNKILIIDFDPQGNSLQSFGFNSNLIEHSIYDVFYNETNANDIIIKVSDNIDLLPSNIDMRGLDIQWGKNPPETSFHNMLNQCKDYDYILIDTTPTLGITTLLSLYESWKVVVPFVPDTFGIKGITDVVDELKKEVVNKNKKLEEIILIPTMFVSNSVNQLEILNQLDNFYKKDKLIKLSNNKIKRSVIFQNSLIETKKPLTLVKSKNNKIIKSLNAIKEEILKEIKNEQ